MFINENLQKKGAIFDLDGTVIDSMQLWLDIDREFFERRNMKVPCDYQKSIAHLGLRECAKFTIKEYGLCEKENDLILEWEEMCLCRYEGKDSARFIKKGASEYLRKLKNSGVKLAVATANSPSLFMPILKNNNLYELFNAFTTGDEVGKNKACPDIFIESAKKLGLNISDCVVYEDSLVALKTAKSLNMQTVGVFDESSIALVDDIKRVCDKFIYNFTELL